MHRDRGNLPSSLLVRKRSEHARIVCELQECHARLRLHLRVINLTEAIKEILPLDFYCRCGFLDFLETPLVLLGDALVILEEDLGVDSNHEHCVPVDCDSAAYLCSLNHHPPPGDYREEFRPEREAVADEGPLRILAQEIIPIDREKANDFFGFILSGAPVHG